MYGDKNIRLMNGQVPRLRNVFVHNIGEKYNA
jgi:hypothetical protein